MRRRIWRRLDAAAVEFGLMLEALAEGWPALLLAAFFIAIAFLGGMR